MILDSVGNPFYWHKNKERSITFNLPVGKYETDNVIKKLPSFRSYGHTKFPKEFDKQWLNNLELKKSKNPNKASITLQRCIIIVDPKYYESPYLPLQTFTLLHECFHYFFHSKTRAQKRNRFIHQHIEKQCDENARNYMLANGWNPTQVLLSIRLLLKGEERKEVMRQLTTDKKNNFRR